jgi:cation transporter-like permease
MIGGIGLEITEKDLLPIVPLVIALPALNTMVGNYAAIIAAHAGNPNEQSISRRKLISSIAKSTTLNIAGTVILSLLLAHSRGFDINISFIVTFALFVIFSVSIIVTIMFGITYALEHILEKNRLNPDDVLIPVVTTVTDVFMLGLIALAAKLLF